MKTAELRGKILFISKRIDGVEMAQDSMIDSMVESLRSFDRRITNLELAMTAVIGRLGAVDIEKQLEKDDDGKES